MTHVFSYIWLPTVHLGCHGNQLFTWSHKKYKTTFTDRKGLLLRQICSAALLCSFLNVCRTITKIFLNKAGGSLDLDLTIIENGEECVLDSLRKLGTTPVVGNFNKI